MSKEKQIEEMAKLLCTVMEGDCDACVLSGRPSCPSKREAERLYNAGYRKQSEGEWVEVQREWDFDPFFYIDFTCSVCGSREQNKRKFCPNCGAKMGKEDEGK